MKTLVFKENIEAAARILRGGGLVAVPTETVYGLAANGLDSAAVERIYEVKGRPSVKPLALMVQDARALADYCEQAPRAAHALAERFWPGPLTIVLKSKDTVPEIVRAGGDTVALRCPDHAMTLATIAAAGVPLAAPSANPSGAASPTTAAQVLEYFDGQIEGVIDGGECGIGSESTIIDLSRAPYRILREGALAAGEIEGALIKNMRVFGVTGGTGCGKTTALGVLKKMGALVIDCDELYHGMLETDSAMLGDIPARFPGSVVDGRFNIKALGAIVFSDEAALLDLNEITHGHVLRRLDELLAQHAMNGGRLAAIDAIALIESGAALRCDTVIGVLADFEGRVLRIMDRDDISREYAEKRVRAQKDDDFFREGCDKILYNTGTREEFIYECEKYFTEEINDER